MNRLILCILFVTLASCHKVEQKPLALNNTSETVEPVYGPLFTATIPNRSPYETGLKIELMENNTYRLVIDMKLFDGAHFVSPFSKVDYKGRFRITINDEDQIQLVEKLTETPSTVEEYDNHPFVNGPINWVKENTTYKQPFEVLTEKDFSVQGNIQFTIEPRCTTEFIPFSIYSKNGKLEVKVDGC